MNATLLYRVAAFVFLVTAVGHTYAILSPPPPSPGAREVYDSMNNVRFQAGGRSFSYGRVYRGLGLMGTASMLFWAFLSWQLGDSARTTPGRLELWVGHCSQCSSQGWCSVSCIFICRRLCCLGLPQ